MKKEAAIHEKYGAPEVLHFSEQEKPAKRQ
jgi:hypothetical protein